MNAMDVIVNGGSGIRASEASDEGCDGALSSGGSDIFRQPFDITVDMVDEDTCTVRRE